MHPRIKCVNMLLLFFKLKVAHKSIILIPMAMRANSAFLTYHAEALSISER